MFNRCDSLSNLYLWHIKYSGLSPKPSFRQVVIRFQICIFDILNTAFDRWRFRSWSCDSLSNLYLWHIKYSWLKTKRGLPLVVIRFQICIFDILNTAVEYDTFSVIRCDSLSNLYLWHIKYSAHSEIFRSPAVVIRFQICIFDILNTADTVHFHKGRKLWFAFKFVSLTY